jgi:hypothetical protein
VTFTDEAPTRRADPVVPAHRSTHAKAKISAQQDEFGNPCRTFGGLLEHLATLTRNQVHFPGSTTELPMLADSTPPSTARAARPPARATAENTLSHNETLRQGAHPRQVITA